MRLLLILFLTGVSVVLAKAQPNPPQFDCIVGDTLTWTQPTDACGALTSIDVYGSPNENGPFTLLWNVPVAEGPRYELTPSESIANDYFYLVANYASCSPDMSIPSDTLTVSAVTVPRINEIVYTTTGTFIDWEFPPDPRVTGFLIYRETDLGTTLLDTVFGTEYFEANTQVENAGAIYYLGSLDDCRSSSFSDATYSSVTVRTERDACAEELRIGRQLPAPWPHPFVEAIIVRDRFGGSSDTVRVNNPDSLITITDIESDTAYTITVTFVDDQGGSTTSLPVDLGAEAFVANDIIEIAQVTFEPSGWQLRWRWDPAAGYENTEYIIRRGGEVIEQVATDPDFDNLPAPVTPLGLDASFDWTNAEVLVRSTDACGVVRESNVARPSVVFAQETGPFSVAVDWTLPQANPIALADWTLRFFDLSGSRPLFNSDTLVAYVHDVESINVREVCYEVVTEVRLPAVLRRPEARFLWRSAPGCALRTPRVFLPTGFIPEGFTIAYRPKMSLIEGLTYEFKIFDRWGKLLFETTDPFGSWDGRINGKEVPPGAYLAAVRLEEDGRAPIKVDGVFTLIR